MKPLDPRLVRTTRAVRVHLAVTVACGVALTGLILLQAWLVARAVARAPVLDAGGSWTDVGGVVALVGVVALARAALAYGAETAALRSAAAVKSQLRRRLVAHVTGPGADPATLDPGELATLTTRGLDALDDYVARYLPQLVLAVLVPIAVLVVVLDADWLSALIIALTLPLIPVFMALVGWQAQDHTRKQWRLLNRLGGHFLDAVEGLPTLAIFRRARAEAALVRRTSEAHREATMRTLRIAFLSALVLELLATLSVALVAVQIGIRLLYGQLDLETALLVLILAPEAYLPLREVGARFHASMEGVAAAEQVFTVLERPGRVPPDRTGAAAVPDGPVELRCAGVRLTHPERTVAGAGRRRPGGPRRADAAADRDERGGQDDPALGAAAVRRRRRRADHGERDGPGGPAGAGVAPPDRVAAAAAVPVRRQRGRQRAARGARRRRRGRRAGRRARRGRGRRRRAAGRVRHAARRARHPAVGGPAPADRPRAGLPAPAARRVARAARRAHRAPRPGQRGGRPRRGRPAPGRRDGDRRRPRHGLGGPRGRGRPAGGGPRRGAVGCP